MSAVLMKDHPLDEAGVSNARNRPHIRGTVMAQGGWIAEARIVPCRESLRVLIVDNYRASADTMAMLVGAWGHDVRRAYDGATGLALAAAYQPDVLLLDIIMPEIGGLELAMQVRRQSRLSDCLLVAVTGRTDAAHRLQCEEAGMDLFLLKPVDLVFLRTLLTAESEHRLQSRRETKTNYTLSTTLEQLADTARPTPTQLACRVMQALAAPKRGCQAC